MREGVAEARVEERAQSRAAQLTIAGRKGRVWAEIRLEPAAARRDVALVEHCDGWDEEDHREPVATDHQPAEYSKAFDGSDARAHRGEEGTGGRA